MNSNFIGTGVALVTPFKEDLSIDYAGLQRLLQHVSTQGANYLVVNGTTGESATTTTQEKSELLTYIVKANTGLPVVFGIGGNNTQEVIERIQKTDFSGVSGLLSVSPYYSKPSQEGIFQHFKTIAEASPVPVILYNVPGRTGSNMLARTTIRLAALPNIIGIKESCSDITQSLEIMKHTSEEFLLISGDDMLTLPVLALGGKGAISVLSNAYPKQFSQMVQFGLDGNFKKATSLLKSLYSINHLMYEEGNPVGVKTVLELLQITSNEVRLPLAKASAALRQKINEAMQEIK